MSQGVAAPQIIVVGGSVGGLSAAYALLQAGCSVRVLERAAEVNSPTGAVRRIFLILNPKADICEHVPQTRPYSACGKPSCIRPCACWANGGLWTATILKQL